MMSNKIKRARERERRRRESKFLKWWHKYDYIFIFIFFLYISIPAYIIQIYNDKRYKSLRWSDEKCKECLDKIVPRLAAECDKSEILFTNSDDINGIYFYRSFNSPYIKRRHPNIFRFLTKFSGKLLTYVVEKYEIEGYSKIILRNRMDWYDAKYKFEWKRIPWNADNVIGIVFYPKN